MTSDDLIQRLRYLARDVEAYESPAMKEAADALAAAQEEIERLRKALDDLVVKYDAADLATHEPPSLTKAFFNACAALGKEE